MKGTVVTDSATVSCGSGGVRSHAVEAYETAVAAVRNFGCSAVQAAVALEYLGRRMQQMKADFENLFELLAYKKIGRRLRPLHRSASARGRARALKRRAAL